MQNVFKNKKHVDSYGLNCILEEHMLKFYPYTHKLYLEIGVL